MKINDGRLQLNKEKEKLPSNNYWGQFIKLQLNLRKLKKHFRK